MQTEVPDQPAALFMTPQPSFSSSNHTEMFPHTTTLEKELVHTVMLPSSSPAIELPERNQLPEETIPSKMFNEMNVSSKNSRNRQEPQDDVLKLSAIQDAVEDTSCKAASSKLVPPDLPSEGWDDDAFDVEDEDEIIEVEPFEKGIKPDDEMNTDIVMDAGSQSDQPVDLPDTLETTEPSLDEVISEKNNDEGRNAVSEAFEETASLVAETQLLYDKDEYPTATPETESHVETCVDKAHESIVGENDAGHVVASNNDYEMTPEPNEVMSLAENELTCEHGANGGNSVDERHSPESFVDESDKIVIESNETLQDEEVVLPQISLSKEAPDDSNEKGPEDIAKSQIISSDEVAPEMDGFKDASVKDDAEEVTQVAPNDSAVSTMDVKGFAPNDSAVSMTDDVNNEADTADVELVEADKAPMVSDAPSPSLLDVQQQEYAFELQRLKDAHDAEIASLEQRHENQLREALASFTHDHCEAERQEMEQRFMQAVRGKEEELQELMRENEGCQLKIEALKREVAGTQATLKKRFERQSVGLLCVLC